MLVYTDEEKTQDNMKMTTTAVESWLRMVESMKASEAYRSITRRVIAFGVVFNVFALVWICVAIELLASFNKINIQLISDSTDGLKFTSVTWTILKLSTSFQLGWAFCTVIIFYFGPQLAQILTGNKKK